MFRRTEERAFLPAAQVRLRHPITSDCAAIILPIYTTRAVSAPMSTGLSPSLLAAISCSFRRARSNPRPCR